MPLVEASHAVYRLDHGLHATPMSTTPPSSPIAITSPPGSGRQYGLNTFGGLEPAMNDQIDVAYLRPRRRFLKSGMTTYEQCISKNAMGRRGHRRNASLGTLPLSSRQQLEDEAQGMQTARSPPQSSLTHVLNEVIFGRPRALSNYCDATVPSDIKAMDLELMLPDGSDTSLPPSLSPPRYVDTLGSAPQVHATDDISEHRQTESELTRRRWPSRRAGHQRPSSTPLSDRASLLDFSTVKGRRTKHRSSSANLNELVQYVTPMSSSSVVVEDDEVNDADGENDTGDDDIVVLELEHENTLAMLDGHVRPSLQVETVNLAHNATIFTASPLKEVVRPGANVADADNDEDVDIELPKNAFQNVRDIDFTKKSDSDQEQFEMEMVEPEATTSADLMVRYGVAAPQRNNTNVVDFLGGFKSMNSRSRRTGHQGVISRAKAVRRKTGAQGYAAALMLKEERLARRLKEARDRVPPEFRDDRQSSPPQMKIKNPFRSKRVRFDLSSYVREFEVLPNASDAEEEDDQNWVSSASSGNEGDIEDDEELDADDSLDSMDQ